MTCEIIIDSHQHFWDIGRFEYKWMPAGPNILRRNYLPPDLKPLLDDCRVSGTVLVEAHNSVEETQYLLGLARDHSFISGVVGWVDLTDPDVGTTLESLAGQGKLVGIRHQVESDPDDQWLIRDAAIRGFRELAGLGLAYDLVVFPRHLKTIPVLAQELPELRMVLDHLGKPPIAEGGMEPWAADIEAIAKHPNVYCKVSGMVTEADQERWTPGDLQPYAAIARRAFGMQRLMWGSDWPVCLKAASYGNTLESALTALGPMSASERSAFLGMNAASFYRLPWLFEENG